MFSRLRQHLTYANVVATIALFVALGGASYAAIRVTGRNVPRDALTGADIKNLTGRDVRNNTLDSRDIRNLLATDFRPGQLPRGEKGETGATGAPGSLPDTLPSGKTLRGMYRMESDGDNTGSPNPGVVLAACCTADSITFAFPLVAAPAKHFIPDGGAADPACPGSAASPQANPGHLCVYENTRSNVLNAGVVNTTRYGADLFADSVAIGGYLSGGTWAVTAP